MKTRKIENQVVENQNVSCCGPASSEAKDPCCDQPTGGGECCDKNESKEINSVKTGCC